MLLIHTTTQLDSNVGATCLLTWSKNNTENDEENMSNCYNKFYQTFFSHFLLMVWGREEVHIKKRKTIKNFNFTGGQVIVPILFLEEAMVRCWFGL